MNRSTWIHHIPSALPERILTEDVIELLKPDGAGFHGQYKSQAATNIQSCPAVFHRLNPWEIEGHLKAKHE